MSDVVERLPLICLRPGPSQPRRRFSEAELDELAASIRMHGILQPLIVRPHRDGYEIIAGERRFRAAQRLGHKDVPAIIRKLTDEQALEAALVENLQREDLTVVEAARAYRRLEEEFHYAHGEIAQRTGKSRTSIVNALRLLHLPEVVLDLLEDDELSEGHARALLALPYASVQGEVAEWIVRNGVSVREAERKIRTLIEPHGSRPGPEPKPTDVHLGDLEERLRQRFGTKALVRYRKGRGSLLLEFYSDEDLERMLELLGC
jgi:ParB family transcriptional regulator, chromosome partitioning protein